MSASDKSPSLESNGNATGAQERATAIIRDLLVNHMPRVQEGLEKGYVDENQVLVIYDHCVRARILTEHATEHSVGPGNEAGAAQVSEDWQIRQSSIWRGKQFIGSVTMAGDLICKERNAEMRLLRSELEQAREARDEAWNVVGDAAAKLSHARFPSCVDDGSSGGQPITLDEQVNDIVKLLSSLREVIEQKDAVLVKLDGLYERYRQLEHAATWGGSFEREHGARMELKGAVNKMFDTLLALLEKRKTDKKILSEQGGGSHAVSVSSEESSSSAASPRPEQAGKPVPEPGDVVP